MKTNIISAVLLILLVLPGRLFAQEEGKHHELTPEQKAKIDAFRIAFFTENVKLTPQEATAFWPLYNDYRTRQDKLMDAFRDKYGTLMKDPDRLSDSQAKEIVDAFTMHRQAISGMTTTFYTKVQTILPPQKVIRLMEAEREFKRALLKRMDEFRPEKK